MKIKYFFISFALLGLVACCNDEPQQNENTNSNEQTENPEDNGEQTIEGDIFHPICNLFDISSLPFDAVSINDGREYDFTIPAEGGVFRLVQSNDAYLLYMELGEDHDVNNLKSTVIPIDSPVQLFKNIYWELNGTSFESSDYNIGFSETNYIFALSIKSSEDAPLELTFTFNENTLSESREVEMFYRSLWSNYLIAQNKLKFVQEGRK